MIVVGGNSESQALQGRVCGWVGCFSELRESELSMSVAAWHLRWVRLRSLWQPGPCIVHEAFSGKGSLRGSPGRQLKWWEYRAVGRLRRSRERVSSGAGDSSEPSLEG